MESTIEKLKAFLDEHKGIKNMATILTIILTIVGVYVSIIQLMSIIKKGK